MVVLFEVIGESVREIYLIEQKFGIETTFRGFLRIGTKYSRMPYAIFVVDNKELLYRLIEHCKKRDLKYCVLVHVFKEDENYDEYFYDVGWYK